MIRPLLILGHEISKALDTNYLDIIMYEIRTVGHCMVARTVGS